MSKYIIELDDRIKLVTSVGFTENGVVYTTSDYVHNLEELNSDYINEHFGELQDEAYQRGHDDGYEAGCATAFKPVSDAEYQRGLNDAWEAARRIVCKTDVGGMALDTLKEVFGLISTASIIADNTAQEAIDKIKAYEDKHSDCIEVGDEVIAPCGKAIVTAIKNEFAYYLYADGDCGCTESKNLKKTGKHYDIASILEAMRDTH